MVGVLKSAACFDQRLSQAPSEQGTMRGTADPVGCRCTDGVASRIDDGDILEQDIPHARPADLLLLELDVAAESRPDRRAVPEGDVLKVGVG